MGTLSRKWVNIFPPKAFILDAPKLQIFELVQNLSNLWLSNKYGKVYYHNISLA